MLSYLSKVWYILAGSRKNLFSLISIFIASSILESFGIGLIGPFFDLASAPEKIYEVALLRWIYEILGFNKSEQFIPVIGLAICSIFIIKSIFYYWAKLYIFKYSFAQKGILSLKLLNAYLKVPYTFYLSRDTASLINNILTETYKFCYGCILPLLNGISNFFVISVLIVLLASVDSTLLTIILAVLLPTFLFFYSLRGSAKKWGREISESNHAMIRVINHGLGGIKETRVVGCESHFLAQMDTEAKKFAIASTLYNSFQTLPRITLETIIVLFLILFVSIYQLVFGKQVEELISVLSVFAIASIRMIPSASQAISSITELQSSKYALDMLYADLKIVEQHSEQQILNVKDSSISNLTFQSALSPNEEIDFTHQVDLQNITYRYPGVLEDSIKDISLTFKKGESIALVGKSGAGKTTLVDIVLGLLEPTKGDIQVDKVSVYKNIRAWQNLIGYIPQSIFLIDDTIEKNIAFGVPEHLIDAVKLDQAVQSSQLAELIEELPDGIHTSVGERGVRLSGGQRQRIGIARALYHGREILVLDEATSALDNETEKLVNQAIQALSGIKTVIIIAHRLSTIQHCDRVYLLEKGSIVRSGSYQEVVPKYLEETTKSS
jgi:ABC-type multidrug transport system fused ATPase/permease subunit